MSETVTAEPSNSEGAPTAATEAGQSGGRPTTSAPFWVAIVLAVAHLAFSYGINPPGYLTYDSGTYHFMAKTFAESGTFLVWNGYEEWPTDILRVAQLKIHDGHLVAQYPELLTVLGYPFYALFGYPGLFLLQAVAFLGINLLLFRLAMGLFDSRRIAWLSLGVYSFGTFAWEYSQSSYPHLLSTFFVLAAYTLLAEALPWGQSSGHRLAATPSPRRQLLLCFAAGLAAGLAPGVRLDATFAIAGLFVPFLLLRPFRLSMILATGAGLVPGMLFLSVTNWIKFDVFFPFHYGESRRHFYTGNLSWYLPILAALVVVAVVTALFVRSSSKQRRGILLAGGVAILVAGLSFPATVLAFIRQIAEGTWQIVVDLRIRDMAIQEPGLSRSPQGAMVYIGGVKKALLQSCPYLIVTLVSLIDGFGDRRRLAKIAFLCLVPLTFIAFYGYLAWHGSVALNMRYLNPILPFLALLTAWTLAPRLDHVSPRLAGGATVGAFVALWLTFRVYPFSLLDQEIWLLSAPLVMALALLALEVLRRSRLLPSLGHLLVAYGLLFAVAWSGAVTLGRDYPASAHVRGVNLAMGQAFAEHLQDDVLVLTDFADFTWHLIDQHDRVRIAGLSGQHQPETEALIQHHLQAGRRVYLAGSAYGARRIVQSGYFQAFRVTLIRTWDHGGLPSVALLELESPDGSFP